MKAGAVNVARVAAVVLLLGAVAAHAAGPKQAIEQLERCSAAERASGCVKILKKKSSGGDLQEIKAQIRGGRIIRYQYDRKTGRARRLN